MAPHARVKNEYTEDEKCHIKSHEMAHFTSFLAAVQHNVHLHLGCSGVSGLYHCALCGVYVFWICGDWTIPRQGKHSSFLSIVNIYLGVVTSV